MTVEMGGIFQMVIGGLLGSLITHFLTDRGTGKILGEMQASLVSLDARVETLEKQYILVPRRRSDDDGFRSPGAIHGSSTTRTPLSEG